MSFNLEHLAEVVSALRDPETGCPWDLEQTLQSLTPYTLEETHELIEAIHQCEPDAIARELGDLLFHIVLIAQIASESSLFTLEDVVSQASEKIVRRHPHVFGDAPHTTPQEQAKSWTESKSGDTSGCSILDGIPSSLPPFSRACKIQQRAASVGFDWAHHSDVIDKIHEELQELQDELDPPQNRHRIQSEMGDLLFACVNLARHLAIHPDAAITLSQEKFEKRFQWIEEHLREQATTFDGLSEKEMIALWEAAKSHVG